MRRETAGNALITKVKDTERPTGAEAASVNRFQELKMQKFIRLFKTNESGAVTVDWTVIVAGVVALSLVAVGAITQASNNLAARTGTTIAGGEE